jgi:hypothetical protein
MHIVPMFQPALSPAEVDSLRRAEPSLPSAYLAFMTRHSLAALVLGRMRLCPGGFANVSLGFALELINRSLAGPEAVVREREQLFTVGELDGDSIAIALDGANWVPGTVVWVDLVTGFADRQPLAPDFTHFITLASAYHELFRAQHFGKIDLLSALADMDLLCRIHGLEAYAETWQRLVRRTI